ncbi:hypothetical protein SLS62_009092, partial [Diatrype stigma]
ELIAALVMSHDEKRKTQVEDVVYDKGKGLALLLHASRNALMSVREYCAGVTIPSDDEPDQVLPVDRAVASGDLAHPCTWLASDPVPTRSVRLGRARLGRLELRSASAASASANGKLGELHLKEVCEMTMEFQEQPERQFVMQQANNEAGGRYQPFGVGQLTGGGGPMLQYSN